MATAVAAGGCAMPAAVAASGTRGALPRSRRAFSFFGAHPRRDRPFFGRRLRPSSAPRRSALPSSTPSRPFTPVMEWQDCSAEIVLDVPCSLAYDCYSDRETIPQWMPFISSVKVLKDKPDLSRWTLKYEVFGRDVEFSWLARNLQPIRNQKIHWRSLEGLPNRYMSRSHCINTEQMAWLDMKLTLGNEVVFNCHLPPVIAHLERGFQALRGAVRFYPKGPSSCRIELTVSYEVPQILIPVASALKPFLEGLLLRGLEQFATVAKSYQSRVS